MTEIRFSAMANRAGQGDAIAPIFMQVMAAKGERQDFVDFAAGPPPNDLLPSEAFGTLIDEVRTATGPGVLNYTRPAGVPDLAKVWAAELADQYSITVDNPMERLLVTSGGMEGMALAMLALVDPGDRVLVESPAFPGTLAAVRLAGGEAIHVGCDESGMIPAELEAAIAEYGARVVSVMPDFQNPSGRSMPEARRREIAEILRKTGAIALEDGVYAPLRFAGEPLPALYSLAPDNVVYATSVSKSMAPAERVGAVVAQPAMISRLASMKGALNMQASGILQAVAAAFMQPGGPMKGHLEQLLPHYAERCRLMREAIQKYCPAWTMTDPAGGMFLWVTAPEGVDFGAKLDDAIKNGVGYIPGSLFYADPARGHNQVRLNFASTNETQIEAGVKRLAETLAA